MGTTVVTTRRAAGTGALMAALVGSAAGARGATTVAAGDWRFAIATPIGELPFNVELKNVGSQWIATLINGTERIVAEATSVDGATLTLTFPSYGSVISGTVGDDGKMKGEIRLTRATGPVVLTFAASHGESYRFFPDGPAPAADVGGRWAVTTTAADGNKANGLGEWTQKGAAVNGSVIYVNADHRFLTGEMRGSELFLSTFDGGFGTMWRGKLGANGEFSGQSFSMAGNAVSTWIAHRNETAELPDPNTLTYLKPGYDRFTFRFPNLDGMPVSIDDPAYKGKVVIITIAGTWCPTCHDEAAFLAPYIKANRARGLEAIALQYEFSPEFDKATAACRNFAKRYGIDYDMLIAGTSDKAAASKTLPMINAVLVYPTMIFVDRRGEVRRIHTSFPGPATGIHHERFKREFHALMDELLGEGV
ncbi:MAG: TlpA family protein disulfide reductase [Alphaproteobacteria bacterium]|nr:TlpA family protein disulfide reductase [Alphaproteobacteria bacterium]